MRVASTAAHAEGHAVDARKATEICTAEARKATELWVLEKARHDAEKRHGGGARGGAYDDDDDGGGGTARRGRARQRAAAARTARSTSPRTTGCGARRGPKRASPSTARVSCVRPGDG